MATGAILSGALNQQEPTNLCILLQTFMPSSIYFVEDQCLCNGSWQSLYVLHSLVMSERSESMPASDKALLSAKLEELMSRRYLVRRARPGLSAGLTAVCLVFRSQYDSRQPFKMLYIDSVKQRTWYELHRISLLSKLTFCTGAHSQPGHNATLYVTPTGPTGFNGCSKNAQQ